MKLAPVRCQANVPTYLNTDPHCSGFITNPLPSSTCYNAVCRAIRTSHPRRAYCDPGLRNTRMTASEEDEAQSDSKGRGFIGELLGIFSGGEKSNAADGIIGELCRIDGWDVKMQIGSDEARKLGGTGKLARGGLMTVGLGVTVRMERDEGYFPPQGTVYVPSSTVFKEKDGGEMKGFWRIEDEDKNGLPTTLSMSLKCPDGIKVSGEEAIAPGFMYANMRIKQQQGGMGALKLYDGRVTVKEDLDSTFLFQPYNGLIAEFKLVGICEASPHVEKP